MYYILNKGIYTPLELVLIGYKMFQIKQFLFIYLYVIARTDTFFSGRSYILL